MNRIFLLILFVSSSILCLAQNELKTKEDSIHDYEVRVEELIAKLNYGEAKLTATDKQGDVTCEVRKAYYDDNYIIVELQFLCENGDPALVFSTDNGFNTTNFCLLAEKLLKAGPYDISSSEKHLKLEERIPQNMTVHFSIYNRFKGSKPRLIEYMKLTEKQKGQEFVFRNIPIVYDED